MRTSFSPLIERMIEALRCLPGVGRKSAQRMALHLLERDRTGGVQLAQVLQQAMVGVGRCQDCRTHSEASQCPLCVDPRRDSSQLCVVETPADVLAVEQAGGYRGCYFVLLGHLSPLDGLGPREIGLDQLLVRLQQGKVKELIIATNATVEGEATAHYIHGQSHALANLQVSRIAHGVPLGGELEYVDGGTLVHAFAGRKTW
jgi:recombination protein RecR